MPHHYRNILTPLDGSQLSEAALPHAFSLAALAGAQLTLLVAVDSEHVIEPSGHEASVMEEALDAWLPTAQSAAYRERNTIFVDEQWEAARLDAHRYLKSVSGRFGGGADARLAVELGSPAETILAYAHTHAVDLIVMSTHGRTGLRRMVYGSVADEILRSSRVPVLLVRAPVGSEPSS